MTKRVLSAALALCLSLALAACGGGTGSITSTTTAPASTSSDEHNAVDVMFVTMMIPHHEGAIEMSDLALAQASSQQVRDLAARINAAQGPEIERMEGRLAAWGATVPMTSASSEMDHGMDHGSPTTGRSAADDFGMGGMMTMGESDMVALRAATGVEFDKLFLQQMIAHHQGAIDMAEVEAAQGQHPQTLVLAEEIKTGQTSEIVEMQQLLSTL